MSEYNLQSESTQIRVVNLTARIKALKQKFAENEVHVQRAEEEAKEAEKLAIKAEGVSWIRRSIINSSNLLLIIIVGNFFRDSVATCFCIVFEGFWKGFYFNKVPEWSNA